MIFKPLTLTLFSGRSKTMSRYANDKEMKELLTLAKLAKPELKKVCIDLLHEAYDQGDIRYEDSIALQKTVGSIRRYSRARQNLHNTIWMLEAE
jgi:hypothetical protein